MKQDLDQFQAELDKLIRRYTREGDLTIGDLILSLEMTKLNYYGLMQAAKSQQEDDE